MTKTDTIDFKDWTGALNEYQYVVEIPEENETVLIDEEMAKQYNKKEKWKVFSPACDIKRNRWRAKTMIWKFSFKNKQQKESIKGDISSREFWMRQFKDNNKTKDSFKKALGRSRGRYKQLAVVIAGLDVYVVLCLNKGLQYLKKELFENYWESAQKDLGITFKTKKGDGFILKAQEIDKDSVFSSPMGMGIPVPGYNYDGEEVMVGKEPSGLLAKESFFRGYEEKINKQKRSWFNKNSKEIELKTTKEYNTAKNRNKVIAGQEAYQNRVKKFQDKYQEQLARNGKLGAQRWLEQGISTFFNLKGFIFEQYGLKKAKTIRGKTIINKEYDPKKEKYNITTGLFITNPRKKESIEIGGLVYDNENIRDTITNKVLKPNMLFKEIILNSQLEKWGFKRKKFLKYWDGNKKKYYSLLNTWLRDGLGISFSGDNKNTDIAKIENKPTMTEKERKNKGLAEKQSSGKLKEIKDDNLPSRWSEFIDFYRGGQIAQKRFFNKKNITKKELIKLGSMKNCLIFPMKGLIKVLKGKNLKDPRPIIRSLQNASMIHEVTKEDGLLVENIKLLDLAFVGTKKDLRTQMNNNRIPKSLKPLLKHFEDGPKYGVLQVANEFYEKGNSWTHSVISITSEDFLRLNDTAKNIGYTLLARAKQYQALPENGSGFGGYGYPIGNSQSETFCNLDYLKKKFGISYKSIKRNIKKLKDVGLLKTYTVSQKDNKVYYRISKDYVY